MGMVGNRRCVVLLVESTYSTFNDAEPAQSQGEITMTIRVVPRKNIGATLSFCFLYDEDTVATVGAIFA